MINRISLAAAAHLEGTPGELLTRMLSSLESQSQLDISRDDPGSWANQALARVQEWLGAGMQPPGAQASGTALATGSRKSKLTRALETAAEELAEVWERRLLETITGLMEHPGQRCSLAESALTRLIQHCLDASTALHARLQQKMTHTHSAQISLHNALEECSNSRAGFSWFGGRSRRALRVFVDHLAAFARSAWPTTWPPRCCTSSAGCAAGSRISCAT